MTHSAVFQGNHLPTSLHQLVLVHSPDFSSVENQSHIADLLYIEY